jgi:DNA polymerase-3 subunit epsilon
MREIVLDTETTGLDCTNGDRLIEIGCVELLNHIPTGRSFHRYLNPRRLISTGAGYVHGITDEFLRDKPFFEAIADEFEDFLGDGMLIAHNAGFDRAFMNMELGRCGRREIGEDRFVDTLLLARRRHPNAPNSLDALCARFGIDNSARTKHGALLDAEILAEVYLELLGGRQATLSLGALPASIAISVRTETAATPRLRPSPLPRRLSAEDELAHAAFVASLGHPPIWAAYR